MAVGDGDFGRPASLTGEERCLCIRFSHRDHNPYVERKEGTDECGECGVGGSQGGICSLWNSRNLTTRTSQCQLFVSPELGSIGGAQALPLPPRSFLFGGDGERGGAQAPLCVWLGVGWGDSKNFRLLSDQAL